jgi:anti-sigma regulatory factor (Ser/Thr protein kinase)
MSPSPAESGPRGVVPLGAAAHSGILAAPVAVAQAQESVSQAGILGGGCFARILPLDRTCAAAARSLFREAVAPIGLPADLVHDGVTMASELAANTLHAQANVEFSGTSQRPVSGCPELWLYARGSGVGSEIVCKVFDSQPGWKSGSLPDFLARTAESVSGRGLQVVVGLSAGQWGAHLSRGRLGSWKVPGKVVWFALRVPPACDLAKLRRPAGDISQGANELETMLAERGLGGRLVRADERAAQMSVLSVSRDLTVWCQPGAVSWRTPDGSYQRLPVADLVEIAEQIVWTHEELSSRAMAARG